MDEVIFNKVRINLCFWTRLTSVNFVRSVNFQLAEHPFATGRRMVFVTMLLISCTVAAQMTGAGVARRGVEVRA